MRKFLGGPAAIAILAATISVSWAEDDKTGTSESTPMANAAAGETSSGGSGSSGSSQRAKTPAPKHAALLKDTERIAGLIDLHYKDTKLYAELSGSDYSREYIVLISIARGIGQGSLLGGMSWGFGDDWVWQFRKVGERVMVLRKNVRFKAKPGSREAFAVQNAYTDSVLFSLPILAKGPGGGDLVDMTSVFMSDLPQISQSLPGFSFSSTKSTWAWKPKGFENNVEIQVAATYASSGRAEIESVADSRGVTINVHYSISALPKSNGYQPRLADDRVGYFLTVVKDYSKVSDRDQFNRYINRWHLEKDDSNLEVSPPKEKIIFWIEKTVPAKYRPAIAAGILEWNKAFEKAGFANAIEVRTQPDDAKWDPEDINYNTFRWITSSAGFAMGPSRVNPYTGQILDADIIFDADFIRFWKDEFDTFTPDATTAMTRPDDEVAAALLAHQHKHQRCLLSQGMSRQLAFGATALMMAGKDPDVTEELKERLIMEGLKEVAMHEVGHTLGLRHNFKGSTWLGLDELNKSDRGSQPTIASVMDYAPANIVPKSWTQGNFFTHTLGPYDIWAIEYGYRPISGGTASEEKELRKIASRSGEPGLDYTTDEDTISSDPDPFSNRFDLGDDLLEYAQLRAEAVSEIIPGLVDRMTEEGDDFTQARLAFNVLLSEYAQSMYFASRLIGGMHTSRTHKGDKGGKPPLANVDPEKQREALAMLGEHMFSAEPFQFPPELYNYLGPIRWQHWGSSPTRRKDFPVHDFISMWQDQILNQVLASVTLERIHDTELKIPANEDAFTCAELLHKLSQSIFAEIDSINGRDYTARKPAISSLRRNLQRIYLRRLSNLALGRTSAPDDCQTIAYAELESLESQMKKLLKSRQTKLDSYSKAHLSESASRIRKVLDARLSLFSP